MRVSEAALTRLRTVVEDAEAVDDRSQTNADLRMLLASYDSITSRAALVGRTPAQQQTLDEHFIIELRRELERARAKFPSANLSSLALAEEVGELAQAVLKVRAGKWQHARVFAEAVQVAAMAMRVALEDDASLSVFYAESSA